MDKIVQTQLPDSSSSPPMNVIFHNFDEEAPSEFPSCVYASHHQSIGNPVNFSSLPPSSLQINPESIRQIQQHYLLHNHPEHDSSSVPPSSSYGAPYKIQRQKSHNREQKNILRSAPNGYFNAHQVSLLKGESNRISFLLF